MLPPPTITPRPQALWPLLHYSFWDRFGDEMRDDWRSIADVKGISVRLGFTICDGHSRVLAHVFNP